MRNDDLYRVVRYGEGRTYDFPGFAMSIVLLATAEDTDRAYSAFESIHEPGSGAPLHIHHYHDETAYIVEGDFLVQSGDEPVVRLGPGSFVHFPRGLAHAFRCVGESTGKIVFWMTPGGFENFFIAASEAIGNGPPDMKVMVALGQEHDSEIIGPPIAASD